MLQFWNLVITAKSGETISEMSVCGQKSGMPDKKKFPQFDKKIYCTNRIGCHIFCFWL